MYRRRVPFVSGRACFEVPSPGAKGHVCFLEAWADASAVPEPPQLSEVTGALLQ